MWHDNDTAVDLLGFEYLVDELEILLTEKRLLPVTIGVNGDWGSGKTSLMRIARERLESGENTGRFICVSFSPWRFEDYHDVKAALMAAVVDAIAVRIEEDEGLKARAGTYLNRVRKRLHDWGVFRQAASIGVAAAGGGLEEAAAAGAIVDVMTGVGADPEAARYERSFETVAHFHEEFAELIDSLGDDIQAVVVFIDDMDRCATTTIIETFEAIGLFLFAEKTAYVVGAHAAVVEAALEGRYPAREGDDDIAKHYLEKMLQNSIAIPPLSEPEARTYINLLYAELHSTDEEFLLLREAASTNRTKNQLAIAMNEGIAREVIGHELSPDLAQAFDIADRIGPLLARGLRGNPRQIKRFLNRLRLRQRAADRRQLGLDPAKLEAHGP
jgi:predicted KAP-like P-loop ATPase